MWSGKILEGRSVEMQNALCYPTHVAYADEAYYNTTRYRSIALVSLREPDSVDLRSELKHLLQVANITEFKWVNLRGARERFAALDMLKWVISKVDGLRVDVLTWDTEDSRHRVYQRDDIENMRIMYYKLFKNVMCERWPNNSTWQLFPDEHTAMRWDETKIFLDIASKQGLRQDFNIEEIIPCKSHEEPFIQVADLFAGLTAYSHMSYDRYERWKESERTRLSVTESEASERFSKSDLERFKTLSEFNTCCKQKKMGVSLQSSHGLRTFQPKKSINFWLYEPQHKDDKAPAKSAYRIIL